MIGMISGMEDVTCSTFKKPSSLTHLVIPGILGSHGNTQFFARRVHASYYHRLA
jgi:hypothetical protein